MDTFWRDVRFAWRQLLRAPGFTLVAVSTLALGIGANTAMFTVVRAVLLRPLPFPAADRLVAGRMSLPDFEDLRRSVRAFEASAVWASNLYVLGGESEEGAEQVLGGVVSEDFFPLLGRAALGRTIGPAEQHAQVVVLADGLWRRRFGADPQVLGRTIRLAGVTYTVIGVMPAEFEYPSARFMVWVPMAQAMGQTPQQLGNRSLRIFRALFRLAPSATQATAQAEVDAVGVRLAREHPQSNEGIAFPLTPVYELMVGDTRRPLLVLMGVVALVLLIACANVANLLLARARGRERELAVRTALGAGRTRVVRQLLTESVLLAVAGSAAGLLVAHGMLGLLASRVAADIPRLAGARLDAGVLAFAVAAALATGLLFGVAPAWQSSRRDLTSPLRDGTRGSGGPRGRRLRSALTMAEVALSLVVLVAAGLLARSLGRLLTVDAGFTAENVLTFHLTMVGSQRTPEQRAALLADVLGRIARQPGVQAVGGTTGMPPVTAQRSITFAAEGREQAPVDDRRAYFVAATPDAFRALGTRVLDGRAFSDADVPGAPEVVLLNRTLARRLFGDERAVGRRLRLVNPEQGDGWRTVVGVVADIRFSGLRDPDQPTIFTPFGQTPFPWSYVMVRTEGPPLGAAGGVREAVRAVDPTLDAAAVRPMTEVVAESVGGPRFQAALLATFAALALALAAIGIYGVVSYSVSQRTQEIGIRMALGAERRDVLRLVTAEGLRLAAAGVAVGLLGAAAASRVLATLLFEVDPTDGPTFAGAAAFLVLVALLASAVPAVRASRLHPTDALRS
jgi:putative ABC transport system permease protein